MGSRSVSSVWQRGRVGRSGRFYLLMRYEKMRRWKIDHSSVFGRGRVTHASVKREREEEAGRRFRCISSNDRRIVSHELTSEFDSRREAK